MIGATHGSRARSSRMRRFFYSSSVFAADVGWLTYANPRFGVAVDYPPAFSLRDPPPDNGDGQTFRTPRGDAVLLVFGSYNIATTQHRLNRCRAGRRPA